METVVFDSKPFELFVGIFIFPYNIKLLENRWYLGVGYKPTQLCRSIPILHLTHSFTHIMDFIIIQM